MSKSDTVKFPIGSVLITWFVLVIVAIFNGAIRNFLVTPYVGEHAGHIISTITFIVFLALVVWIYLLKRKVSSDKTLLQIGTVWVIMTILFEFIFGHFIMGHSWDKLFNDYNLLNGRVWIFVLIATFIMPLIIGRKIKSNNQK